MSKLMSLCQSGIWPILCQLMAILAKLLDMDFKFVLSLIYTDLDIQTNFEVNLVCISKSMEKLGKTNLKSISNNLAKMVINWHKISQMPLWHKNINLGITCSFFVQF